MLKEVDDKNLYIEIQKNVLRMCDIKMTKRKIK